MANLQVQCPTSKLTSSTPNLMTPHGKLTSSTPNLMTPHGKLTSSMSSKFSEAPMGTRFDILALKAMSNYYFFILLSYNCNNNNYYKIEMKFSANKE
jgi:hypothetical protein